uniref:SDR family NAD(P)-dependent oxidoreductase n=1 Tax=Ningiella ruwaisensis TaxID=2364274 RepID=UPI00109F6E54|nr:SDR family NAD(P)-dependent oxidoreductase [Ningiella ruwaisensis]
MQQLENKVFVLSGAGSGIGKALAIALDKQGALLALNDVDNKALEKTAALLSKPCVKQAFSVAERHEWEAFRDQTINAFQHVDGIINNAGIAHEAVTVEHMREEDLRLVMEINFFGVVHGTQLFLPELVKREEASVVNISSIFGVSAVGLQSAYCASKFAVRGYTESLRMEALNYYPKLSVSVVHPGGIQTNIADRAISAGSRTKEEREKDMQTFKQSFITSPEKAASTIIKGIQNKDPRILIGMDAKIIDYIVRFMPKSYSKRILRQMQKNGLIDESILTPLDAREGTK